MDTEKNALQEDLGQAEKKKAYMRSWREQNKDKIREYNKKWRDQNRDQVNEKARQWRIKNREQLLQYQRAWREENREKINCYARGWRQQKREQEQQSFLSYWETLAEKSFPEVQGREVLRQIARALRSAEDV